MHAAITSVLQESRVFPPPQSFVDQATVSGMAHYHALCAQAEADYEGFWAALAREHVLWHKSFTQTLDQSNKPFYRWFYDGELNVSYNCLDRHLGTPTEHKTAIIFEADDGSVSTVSYRQLYERVCRFANGLRALGHGLGERAIIYMPMSIHAVVAMQACARLGITHSVVFGGFSAKSLHERIVDAGATLVIAADEQVRGGKHIPLKSAVDEAFDMGGCEAVRHVVVWRRTGGEIVWHANRDVGWDEVESGQSEHCDPVWVAAEHPLFILYTSGSTGKPKGVQHASGGYLLHALLTMKWTFDIKPSDVFWCTADVGWVTGHTYVAYGPLAAGATEIVFEGIPTYPDAGRFWKTIEKHRCSIFYTAPTAIRSLIKASESDAQVHPSRCDLSSLRLLGSVGEPINPEAWMSYFPEELNGYYLAGDGAVRHTETAYFTITGRIDDVLNVSGHRFGTMEIESALVAHPLVAEAAVVGRPDDVTGEAISAFVVLKRSRPAADEAKQLAAELRTWVAHEIGPIAKPKDIRFGDNLPKTRSGKIMRRLLRAIARGESATQDTSTLENPAILEQLSQSL
ncbi:MAG: acetyl-coenzyme A synthetase [Betaproteobacteria bacterium]|nr:acetyl-coenzyme A synthetase [Betaproteobacteria bacterium]